MSASRTAEPLADEAIDQERFSCPGAPVLFYRAALPLSRPTLDYVTDVIRHHRKKTGSCWRKLNPRQQALLALAYLRKGETFAELGGRVQAQHRDCPFTPGLDLNNTSTATRSSPSSTTRTA